MAWKSHSATPALCSTRVSRGNSLVELLVAIVLITLLAGLLLPALAQAKESALRTSCLAKMRQAGSAMALYLGDFDDRLPDRRDLKIALPGGYRPWSGWPPSDPRAGWEAVVLAPYGAAEVFACQASRAKLGGNERVLQVDGRGHASTLWAWRFDRTTTPTPLDNFWGKSPEQAVGDLQQANDTRIGYPQGVADVEMLVDPYFPKGIASVPANLAGRNAHFARRNRLMLDAHAKWMRDSRLSP